MGKWCCSINANPPAKFHGSRYADTKNVLDSRELVQFLASTGRPESLEVSMQNYDLNEDGNIAFQEAKRVTPTADAKNVSD